MFETLNLLSRVPLGDNLSTLAQKLYAELEASLCKFPVTIALKCLNTDVPHKAQHPLEVI